MIRKDREITDRAAILDIVKRSHVCRLAFNDKQEGYPYIVPMNFGIIDSGDTVSLVFHCAPRGKKLDLLRVDNRVAFELECDVRLVFNPKHGHNTDIYKSVTGRGRAEIVEDEVQKMVLLQALVDRYHDEKLEVTAIDASRCTMFRVIVSALVGKEKKLNA